MKFYVRSGSRTLIVMTDDPLLAAMELVHRFANRPTELGQIVEVNEKGLEASSPNMYETSFVLAELGFSQEDF